MSQREIDTQTQPESSIHVHNRLAMPQPVFSHTFDCRTHILITFILTLTFYTYIYTCTFFLKKPLIKKPVPFAEKGFKPHSNELFAENFGFLIYDEII